MEQIAHNCGVNPNTLYEWQKKYGEIGEALKRGKNVVDTEVENALLKRALGYSYKETTRELMRDKTTGEQKLVVTKEVTKMVVPDTTAQIFWLKNRRPNQWRSKPLDDSEEEDIDATREEVYADGT